MSGSKHTPGPWYVSKDGDDYNITYNDDGNWLATVYDDDDPVTGRPEADALLIASAPDLLAMLKVAQLWLDVDGRFDMQGINAAIAKAEGRS